MKIILKTLVFFLWISLSLSYANQFHYIFPTSISLELAPIKSDSEISQVAATVSSKLGTLTKLEIFFESSPDLTIEPQKFELSELQQDTSKSFSTKIQKGPGKPDEMGSWVKIRVKYFPDYINIQKVIENTASYPVEIERNRLLEILEKNKLKKDKFTSALRFFLK
ncbi:MAG: hypothetical protein HQM08_04785 [Candidatus Riflebacteria bacterium]|nr:hypothetical protein [Candidatus Riflebacteria bacterium]